MSRSRLQRSFTFIITAAFLVSVLSAQKKDEKKPTKAEQAQMQEAQSLVKTVDAMMAGKGAAPTDIPMTWHTDFLKAQPGTTYVPFTITVDPGKVTPGPVAMYLRVAPAGATGPAPAPANEEKKEDRKEKDAPDAQQRPYPFEDVYFIQSLAPAAGQPVRISRAFQVPPGQYDVYVALREMPAGEAGGSAPAASAKSSVMKQVVTVPDYWGSDLTTSSVIMAEKVEALKEPLPKEQQIERPYTLGTTQIVPAPDTSFTQNDELSIIFLIYNAGLTAEKKPDVMVEYNFYQKTGAEEKYFNKTSPENFTNPFDPGAGIPAGWAIPLKSFPAGDYRLEIKITDKVAGKTLVKNVDFTVTA